jgi:hypothetical protein
MRTSRWLPATILLPYLVGGTAIALLVHFGGIWNILANTRLLDVLSRGGIIALTDADAGPIIGVPDVEYVLLARQPVDWELIVVAALIFLAIWALKATQFHGICRAVGVDGSLGAHAKAWFYGHGVGRVLPYDAGKVAKAAALEGQGVALSRASQVVFVASVLAVAEIAALALFALWRVGFATWSSMMIWPLVILLVAYLMVRPPRAEARQARRETLAAAGQVVRELARKPGQLALLFVLGVGSILLVDAACYAVSQAFSNPVVLLNVEGDVLLMGVVAGYIARLITFTPGGIGQWEWGFASALYVGGLGFPEAATIALLVTALRYLVGGVLLLIVTTGYGVETNLGRVTALFSGREEAR